MLVRFTLYLFYAIVFFMLGAWTGDLSPRFHALVQRGAITVEAGVASLTGMARASISASPSAASSKAPPNLTTTLDDARQAAAHGDVNKAIALYSDLLQASTNNADAWGELGNVYLNSGRLSEAAHAFEAAGQARLRQGDIAGARALVPIVQRYDPALAGTLAAQIAAAATATTKGG